MIAASDSAWQEANARYLGASLAWLRLAMSGLQGQEVDLAAALAARQQAAQEAQDCGAPAALEWLAQLCGLSGFERDVILLAAAPELDPAFAAACAAWHGQAQSIWPNFALALRLLPQPAWDALTPRRPLRHLQLLHLPQVAQAGLTAAALRVDERILHLLKGWQEIDHRLLESGEILAPPALDLPAQQAAQLQDILQQVQQEASQGKLPLLQISGADADSRALLAQHVAHALGRQCLRLPAAALNEAATAAQLARLCLRESLLWPLLLYIEDGAQAERAALRSFVRQEPGLILLGLDKALAELGGLSLVCERPSRAAQYAQWRQALPPDAQALAQQMSCHFDLHSGELARAAHSVAGLPPEQYGPALWRHCRDLCRPRLEGLAQWLEAKAAWDDLILPEEQMQMLRQIVAQARARHLVYQEWGFAARMNRGMGISALFAGDSGTGKTMAAEVLARALDLHLYRIDLSQVVSKYIGETEKNLGRLFDAAESGGALLFFDEADALFGRRSEVKDSHDRYANIEINYLLQRIEAFSGVALLATNMKQALDQAFMRRLRFVLHFPWPGPRERARIWQGALPPALPRARLDFERLARLNLSGGNIHSIVLNAAFCAADASAPLDMQMLLNSARAELRKLDKPIVEAEFRS
ncbi:ATP-binding protein [Massilia sp. W12]|uniref:AAA family ATPase n=1 Tax=Massilia sp. W12 TaxID=3126507 RepID=UPI0030D3BD13